MAMLVPALPAMSSNDKLRLSQEGSSGRRFCNSGYSIDYASRFLFPAAFGIFVVGYWLVFQHVIGITT